MKLFKYLLAASLTGCAALTLSGSSYTFEPSTTQTESANGTLKVVELTQRELNISFTNKAKKSARIIWDDTVIVDPDGQTHKIIHGGVKYSKAGESMAPTLVPGGVTINDTLSYADGLTSTPMGDWVTSELIYCSSPGAICSSEKYIGKIMKLVTIVEFDGKREEFALDLKIARKTEKK